ncbi:MAG TPA: ubiquinone biosynthesis regulatory protein kinase UbiB [Usitatibacter sp.]|nr:ubiquinone biosynthesis regulatory protein kinase UbiB [Usitatibacter sp.]
MRALRFLGILRVLGRHRLHELVPPRARAARIVLRCFGLGASDPRPRGARLRAALESLGPVFVKFGQLLSVRPDLVPEDIALELATLQDNVPPVPWRAVAATLDRAYGRPWTQVFTSVDEMPVASASVAQVHFAKLGDGRDAAVKVLRPDIRGVIEGDVALLRTMAGLAERLLPDARRLRPRQIVAELDHTLANELDLLREASNASLLRRNFADGRVLIVPEVYWDYCRRDAMVMERVDGIPVNDVPALRAAGIDIPALARRGVEIFYTQVFRDGFFHADMHPGNILVARDGRYCGVDFGIMGTLSDDDRNYLATNMRAFFERDYRRAAQAHLDAGWVPQGTRVDEFESALRAICEPIFDRPLAEIHFGLLLARLFEVGRRFGMQVQPQLVLLYKTILQVEGLGRQLDPLLDLRSAAQPILERFMGEQSGLRGLWRSLREEAPLWAATLPRIPRLVHKVLSDEPVARIERALAAIEAAQERQARVLRAIAIVLAILLVGFLLR